LPHHPTNRKRRFGFQAREVGDPALDDGYSLGSFLPDRKLGDRVVSIGGALHRRSQVIPLLGKGTSNPTRELKTQRSFRLWRSHN
jgi:hypothetical protein